VGGETDVHTGGDGPLSRVRPRIGAGAPSRSWLERVDPGGAAGSASGEGTAATGAPAHGEPGSVESHPIPRDYREHVRTYFDE